MHFPVPVQHARLTHPKYRADIDGLRAIAILSVVGFHMFPLWFPGGFIGVDIFFVISGFLISTIIFGSLERNNFSFLDFYIRRIKRIFPALLLILFACLLIGWFILTPAEYKQLGKHIAGGAGFISNFILWGESGYFDTESAKKPLLHLWSLGIEEQFYFFWPLLLAFVWKRKWRFVSVTAAIAVISFAFNIYIIDKDYKAAFYLPTSRFWELMIGSILAYIVLHKPHLNVRYKNVQSILGVALIVLGMTLLNKERAFPGWWALLPVLGSFLLISAGQNAWFNWNILSNRLLVWVGLISYPLYLWHWVLISFARIVQGQTPPPDARIAIIFVSFALSWITYQMIERPVRLGGHGSLKAITLLVLMVLTGLTGYTLYRFDGFDFRDSERDVGSLAKQYQKWDYIFNQTCIDKYGRDQLTFCIASNANPEIILFGDSHANQLYPGLVKAYGKSKGILSIGNGPPLGSVKVTFQNVTGHPWLFGHESYKKVLREIKNSDELKTVVLSSSWDPLIHGSFYPLENHWIPTGSIFLSLENEYPRSDNLDVFKFGFEQTIRELLIANKKVVIVIDTPEVMANPELCLKNINSDNFCTFKKSGVMLRQKYFRNYLKEIKARYPQVEIFDPVPIMCPQEACLMHNNKYLLYRDFSHISEYSSGKIGRQLRVVIDSLE